MKIGLISCGKTKVNNAKRIKAKDLYQGTLFKESYKYLINQEVDRIYILSAKYGLVHENKLIDNYEQRMTGRAKENKKWAGRVIAALEEVADLDNDTFIIMAGNDYKKNIVVNLKNYECPLNGLTGLGHQLHWLKDENSKHG